MKEVDRVFDRIKSLCEVEAKLYAIDSLKKEIVSLKRKRCGSCDNWMKSSNCPKEKPTMSGYNEGPNCNTIACNIFVRKKWNADLILEKEQELKEKQNLFELQ